MQVSICTLLARRWDLLDMFRRLQAQTIKDFEWVVIDFYYEEHKESFSRQAEKHEISLMHIPNVRESYPYMIDIARNRNKALTYASGKTIIFLDDYTAINKDFIEQHLFLTESKIVSCGKMYWLKPKKIKSLGAYPKFEIIEKNFISVEDLLQDSLYDEDHRSKMLNHPETPVPALGPEWTYTGNLAFPWEVAKKLNGFDPMLSARGEDGDFGLRANALCYPIMFNPNAKSINLSTDGIPCKQMFDHDHPANYFLDNEALVVSDPETVRKDGYNIVKKYGIEFIICQKCGAECMLNIAKFIYQKLRNNELVVDKKLFDLEKERNRRKK